MRLFVAVYPPPEALDHLAATLETVGGLPRRMTPPERRHLTVAFLGEVEDERPAREALDSVQIPVGELWLQGAGRFGSVLWIGLGGDLDGLAKLNRAVRREMRARRLHPDDKRFRPHLTLARIGPRDAVDEADAVGVPLDMKRLKAYRGPSWPVTELVLVRSELGPQTVYHRLGAWPVPPLPVK